MLDYELDPRLNHSSVWIADLALSELRFKNHGPYPWCILVPRVNQVSELYQLSVAEQTQLMQEITQVSLVMQEIFQPLKLNVASLGNIVAQLHIHIVGRLLNDPLWPQGIWQESAPVTPYNPEELVNWVERLQKAFTSVC